MGSLQRERLYVTSGHMTLEIRNFKFPIIARMRAAMDFADDNFLCPQPRSHLFIPIPFRPRTAAIKVKGYGFVFRVRVACKMRLSEQRHPGHAAFTGKCVPTRIDDFQAEIGDDAIENVAKHDLIAEFLGVTLSGLDQPFGSNDHLGMSGSLR